MKANNMRLARSSFLALAIMSVAACQTTGPYTPASGTLPNLKVSFADPAWNGSKIPDGRQCQRDGGYDPRTPALRVDNIPVGANAIIVEFNDRDYAPLSFDGGHGKIGFWIKDAGQATLPSVPAYTNNLAGSAFVEEDNKAGSARGYVPPCSGGRGHSYVADVKAVYKAKSEKEKSKLLAVGQIELGSF